MANERHRAERSALRSRLLPLHVAVLLQGFMLWTPVEKLFMTEIGFDAAAVGVMAAAYSALIPVVEIPSGILADRWSRRGVLMVSSLALALSALIGGLSTGVLSYIGSALVLGVYFAMYSGTMDAIVYDTVLEQTGGSDDFERRIGRVRLFESISLVVSALLGGWLASITTPRLTYFLTVPFALLSIAAYLRFREPQLHKATESVSLGTQLRLTLQALTHRRKLLPIVTLAALSAIGLQLILEFGPLWLVALAVPAVFYGPYWAGMVSTLGLGGVLAGWIRLDRPVTSALVGAIMTAAATVLTFSDTVAVVMVAQIVLALLLVAAGIHVTRLLHDEIPSTVRTGVASGVSAISWMVFLPVALGFGMLTSADGLGAAGWLLVLLAAATGCLLTLTARHQAAGNGPSTETGPAADAVPARLTVPAP
ncbi:MAG: MFS transporter [Nakamurella sp.]